MNLTKLNTDLSTLGTVTTLDEVSGELRISIAVSDLDQAKIDSYNDYISSQVLPNYPTIDVEAFEGGAIKAIYKL